MQPSAVFGCNFMHYMWRWTFKTTFSSSNWRVPLTFSCNLMYIYETLCGFGFVLKLFLFFSLLKLIRDSRNALEFRLHFNPSASSANTNGAWVQTKNCFCFCYFNFLIATVTKLTANFKFMLHKVWQHSEVEHKGIHCWSIEKYYCGKKNYKKNILKHLKNYFHFFIYF